MKQLDTVDEIFYLAYCITLFSQAGNSDIRLHTELLAFLLEKERTYANHIVMKYFLVSISTFERTERFYKTWLDGCTSGGCPRNVLYNFLQSKIKTSLTRELVT